jgi:hypothetical protein
LNRPEEVEQYFLVYGFYNVQSKKYKDYKQVEKKKKKDVLWQQEEKTTYIQSKESTVKTNSVSYNLQIKT